MTSEATMAGTNPRNNTLERPADEETPLQRRPVKTSAGTRIYQRVKRHHDAIVSKDWADAVLLFCYIITGLLDSSATFIWGSFVSMQTGT